MKLSLLVHEERRDSCGGGDSSTALGSHHQQARIEPVGQDSARGDDGHASRSPRRISGARIEDVVIAAAVDDEGPLVVTRRGDGFVVEVDGR